MPSVIVTGGGLSGLACAAALGASGFDVTVLEARGFLGGRAASYPLPGSGGAAESIDNCQHILLRCCVNLLDFYERMQVSARIRFHSSLYFIEPGGRVSVLRGNRLPAPLHLGGSFLRLRCLSLADKWSIVIALATLRKERSQRRDLDCITMLDWLREKRQTPRAIRRFWRQVLVSAVNEELDRMAALHGFQVMSLGFLASREGYRMGVPVVPLGELCSSAAWKRMANVNIQFHSAVERFRIESEAVRGVLVSGSEHTADYYVCGLPFERVAVVAPELGIDWTGWRHSPITGIHLWFDRPVTQLPHANLLDSTIQWFFNKKEGRYLQLVVSASRSLVEMERTGVIAMALRELGEFLPGVRPAKLEKAHVVKELRATFSAGPGMEAKRPASVTRVRNLFLAGDWTRSGWPATMEGAVRSGYIAAEAVTTAAGRPARFLLPDIG